MIQSLHADRSVTLGHGPLFVTAGQAFVSRCLGEGALGVPLLVSYPGLDVRELWAVWSPELF
jgi:hypothetical protein